METRAANSRPAEGLAGATSFFSGRTRLKARWFWVWGLTALIAIGGTTAAIIGNKGGPKLIAAVAVLALMSFPYMACAYTSALRDARNWYTRSGANGAVGLAYTVLFFLISYLIYAFGTDVFTPFAIIRLLAFAGVPTVLVWTAGRGGKVVWQDFAAVACIWMPFNFGTLDSIWEWPEGQAGYIMNTPMAVDLALLLFLGFRRFDFVPFRFRIKLRDLPLVAKCLLGFMVIALPIGLGTGFLEINPKLEWIKIVGQPLAIFFFIAVPEELLFRGLILGMLRQRTGNVVLSVVISSLLFGISHWHNPGWPNFTYLGLAAIAGLFYGYTFVKSGSLAVSALLHASVDTLWDLFFHSSH